MNIDKVMVWQKHLGLITVAYFTVDLLSVGLIAYCVIVTGLLTEQLQVPFAVAIITH